MGLYDVGCLICRKSFRWFSGNAQVCADCTNTKEPFQKLIRHRIPNLILGNNGKKPKVKLLALREDTKLTEKLFANKFIEEAKEVAEAIEHKTTGDTIEEIGDLYHVIESFCFACGIPMQIIRDAVRKKTSAKGSLVHNIHNKYEVPNAERIPDAPVTLKYGVTIWDGTYEE